MCVSLDENRENSNFKRGMKTLGIIPARYGSTRLPGKALIMVHGRTIIERVYHQASKATGLSDIVVATDDVRIQNHVRKFGGKAVMTRADHESGTTRCAEVLDYLPGFDAIVNIQGDEPLINPAQIDQLCAMMRDPQVAIGTLARRVTDAQDLQNPAEAKIVFGSKGRVVYFSRSPVPHVRDVPIEKWLEHGKFFNHVGMYVFRRDVLKRIGTLPTSDLERMEKLEQLNWLYHGIPIHAIETEYESFGIDSQQDVEMLEKRLSLTE